MNWIVAKIKWIMLVSGALACTMIYAAIAPQAALRSSFGADGPLAEIVVRNWGALIALVGAMLIYGAFNPATRPLQASLAIAVDLVMVVLFIGYLIAVRRDSLLLNSGNMRPE